MEVTARPARRDDLPEIVILYRLLEAEMTELRDMWPVADGLAEPIDRSLRALLDDPDWYLYVGEIDGSTEGFLAGQDQPLLPQGEGRIVGSIELIFTRGDAREVGVAEAMMDRYTDDATARGVERFDAHVSPGHRASKNFFESHGFRARSIIMHKGDR
jgi:L-amino acid N-acyltransferase YncA